MPTEKFFDLYLRGKIKDAAIDQYMKEWRKTACNGAKTDPDIPAHEYLGMTKDEFRQWRTQKMTLRQLVDNRIQNNPLIEQRVEIAPEPIETDDVLARAKRLVQSQPEIKSVRIDVSELEKLERQDESNALASQVFQKAPILAKKPPSKDIADAVASSMLSVKDDNQAYMNELANKTPGPLEAIKKQAEVSDELVYATKYQSIRPEKTEMHKLEPCFKDSASVVIELEDGKLKESFDKYAKEAQEQFEAQVEKEIALRLPQIIEAEIEKRLAQQVLEATPLNDIEPDDEKSEGKICPMDMTFHHNRDSSIVEINCNDVSFAKIDLFSGVVDLTNVNLTVVTSDSDSPGELASILINAKDCFVSSGVQEVIAKYMEPGSMRSLKDCATLVASLILELETAQAQMAFMRKNKAKIHEYAEKLEKDSISNASLAFRLDEPRMGVLYEDRVDHARALKTLLKW